MDPLASNKGFWAEVLGVGDFYYELAVQIVEICLATRSVNGGLMALPVRKIASTDGSEQPVSGVCIDAWERVGFRWLRLFVSKTGAESRVCCEMFLTAKHLCSIYCIGRMFLLNIAGCRANIISPPHAHESHQPCHPFALNVLA